MTGCENTVISVFARTGALDAKYDSHIRGPTGRMERDFSQGRVVIGQAGMALSKKRADLDYILGRNSSP